MTAERITPNGAWRVSGMVGGYLVTRVYYGYTKREALRMFREESTNHRGE